MTTTTNDRFELNQTQLNELMTAMELTEPEVRETIEDVRAEFPGGGITEAKFVKYLSDYFPTAEARKLNVVKHVFDMIDRDKSGNIDIFEYLLIIGLLSKEKPEVILKCLYKLCDSNHDGFLSETEVTNVLSMFMIMDIDGEDKEENIKKVKDETNSSVKKAFVGKSQVSEQEFYKLCTENKDMIELNAMLQSIVGISMLGGMEPFK